MMMMIDVYTHKVSLVGACGLGLQELAKPMFVRHTKGPVVKKFQIICHIFFKSCRTKKADSKNC